MYRFIKHVREVYMQGFPHSLRVVLNDLVGPMLLQNFALFIKTENTN